MYEAIGDTPFSCLYGRECRLPLDVKLLSPADENLTISALEYRKRIVENVELAQNLEESKNATCSTEKKLLL